MAFNIVNIDEPVKLHPLQINEVEGPKGAYEMKKIENGYYLRVDMPGLNPSHFRVTRVKEEKEFCFQGFAKKVDNTFSMEDSNRFYAFTVKVNECQDFDRVVLDHQLKNGTCRILITGVDNASLLFRTPAPENSSDVGPSSSSQPDENILYRAREIHPYTVRIDGIHLMNWHNDDCICCNGNKRYYIFNGPLSEEDGRIYPYIDPTTMGAFEIKFAAACDGSGDYYMYLRLDMPDCRFHNKISECEYMVDKRNLMIMWHSDSSTVEDKFKMDGAGGQRFYHCQITFKCDINCCAFSLGDADSSINFFCDGVFRSYIRVKKNKLPLFVVEEPTPNHPLQHIEDVEGPRGAYEVKKTENGIIYIRIDIPGLNPNDLRVKAKSNLKEIRFKGQAYNFHDNSKRFCCGTIKVECQDFGKLRFKNEFNNGTWITLIKGADNACVTFRSPSINNG